MQSGFLPFDDPEPKVWAEVPQALFLSWSIPRQLDYCARRDEDSARSAEAEWVGFYTERAKGYRNG